MCVAYVCDINREGSLIPTIFQAVELCKELNLTIFLEVKAFVGFGPQKVRTVIDIEIQFTCCLLTSNDVWKTWF